MKKRKFMESQGWNNTRWGLSLVLGYSKKRVICSIIKQIIGYFLWVFYSAYFVQFVIETIQQEKSLKEILLNICVIGGASLLLQAYQYLCVNVIFPLEDVKIHKNVYKTIYKKSENVEIECYENKEFYNKFSIALDGIGNKLGEFVDNFSEIVGGLVGGVLACAAMMKIEPMTLFFLIAPLIGNFFFAPKMNKIFYNRYKDGVPFDRKISYVNRVMYLEKYAKELRLYNIYNVMGKMHKEAVFDKSGLWKKYYGKAFFLGVLQYIFSYVIIFEGILLYGAYRAIVSTTNPISFSQMAVLTSVMVTASWVWVRIIWAYNKNTELGMIVSDLKDFLEYKEKIPEDEDGITPDSEIEKIEFRNVSFAYKGGKKILDNVSFTLKKSEKVALVGHNGAGKTTIIKLLLRLYDPTEGDIFVNDINIRDYNLQKYRKMYSCAFQDYAIVAGTIKENVLMGEKGTDEEVWEALKQAGIFEKVSGLQNGIYTMLTKEFDEDGTSLSGGEYQKIACARVFCSKSQIAVFDEPSSALDPISEDALFNAIVHSVTERIGIFISHRLSCVKDADVVYMFENGQIIEKGHHTELIRLKGSYYNMYRIQERNYFTHDVEIE